MPDSGYYFWDERRCWAREGSEHATGAASAVLALSWGKESKAKGTKCRDLTVLNVPWYSLSFMLFCMS